MKKKTGKAKVTRKVKDLPAKTVSTRTAKGVKGGITLRKAGGTQHE
jgi:hypothetical protein